MSVVDEAPSEAPVLVSVQPAYVIERTDTPLRDGKGWRHTRRRTRRGDAQSTWAWPGETKTYRTRKDAIKAGRRG